MMICVIRTTNYATVDAHFKRPKRSKEIYCEYRARQDLVFLLVVNMYYVRLSVSLYTLIYLCIVLLSYPHRYDHPCVYCHPFLCIVDSLYV